MKTTTSVLVVATVDDLQVLHFIYFFPPNSGNKTDVNVLVLVLVKQYQGKKNNKRPREKIFNAVIKQGYMLLSFVGIAVSVVRLIPIQEI